MTSISVDSSSLQQQAINKSNFCIKQELIEYSLCKPIGHLIFLPWECPLHLECRGIELTVAPSPTWAKPAGTEGGKSLSELPRL